MSEMMKPVAWMYVPSDLWRETVVTDNPEKAQLAQEFGREVTPLYTAAQLQEAARQAMERAAQACLEQASKASVTATDTRDPAFHMIDHAAITRCVNAIRALADVAGEKGVGNV